MKQSRLRTKRYPARRGAQRALALVVFALALFVLSRALKPEEPGGQAGPTPIVPVTPTPSPRQSAPTATPFLDDAPQPGFPTPFLGEEDSASIYIPKLEWHLIQLGAYGGAEAAEQQAKLYTARGAAGYILEDDRFRVIAAAYATREDAETIKARLKEVQGIDAYIYRVSAEEVELSVTAAAAQIQALRDGFDVLREALEEMGRLSAGLDKQTLDGAGVVLGAQEIRRRVREASQGLEAVLGNSNSEVVAGLRTLLGTADSGLEMICAQNTQESVNMTSKIKYHQIDLLWRFIQYVKRITAQSA